MSSPDAPPLVIATGALGRMRELRDLLARAGIASALVSPDPAARRD